MKFKKSDTQISFSDYLRIFASAILCKWEGNFKTLGCPFEFSNTMSALAWIELKEKIRITISLLHLLIAHSLIQHALFHLPWFNPLWRILRRTENKLESTEILGSRTTGLVLHEIQSRTKNLADVVCAEEWQGILVLGAWNCYIMGTSFALLSVNCLSPLDFLPFTSHERYWNLFKLTRLVERRLKPN